jgi:mono/diheme cytochrome c family protein
MKRIHVIAPICLAVAGAAAYGYLTRPDPTPGTAPVLAGAPASASQITRGEYLAKAADCVACHTVPGGKPFAGGLPFKLPFGTIYSSNITADKETGIGNYSDDDFVRALHDGIRRDAKRLYPAFPYTSYSQLSRDDVLAIKAYLSSQPAVKQATPKPDLMFPFNQRWAMGFWNAVFFKAGRFQPAPEKSAEWNSGAYLAIALAHCAECHTPRNIGFALDHRNELSGAVVNGWRAPNITSDPVHGIGEWTDADLYRYLRSGHAAGRGSAAGPMGEAVENSLQYLSRKDIQALMTYLRTVPPRAGDNPTEINAKPNSIASSGPYSPSKSTPANLKDGLRLFEGSCAGCHQWNGNGAQTAYASLLGARSVNDTSGRNVTQIILQGVNMRIDGKEVFMPPFRATFSDTEIAQLSNYVIFQFGGKGGKVTADTVAAQRKN